MTVVVQDGKRYSPFDRDEVHADMREDPIVTRRNIDRQRAVAEAHANCEECRKLLPPQTPNRVGRLQLTLQEVSDLLGLPSTARALRMFVQDDPHALCVIVEDEQLPPVPDGAGTPFLAPADSIR